MIDYIIEQMTELYVLFGIIIALLMILFGISIKIFPQHKKRLIEAIICLGILLIIVVGVIM